MQVPETNSHLDRFPNEEEAMKNSPELLGKLKKIIAQLNELSDDPARHELDLDAIVDLNLARDSVAKLIHRVERTLE